MLDAGAAIVDVGGESTRPGLGRRARSTRSCAASCRCSRRSQGRPVSIDTAKAEVARRALELGAELVNDVTALRGDPELAGVVAEAGAYCCLMHMRGEPRTMQDDPRYDDVVSEVKAFLEERLAFAVSEGIREELVCLDPGIGFGKTVEHNFELVRRLPELAALGRPVVVGFSRKSSLGAHPGRPGGDGRHGSRPRSAPPSPPTSAARRSCACTTSASTSRRSRPRRRSTPRYEDRAARPRALRLPRRPRGRARDRASASSTTSSSRSASAAPTTGSSTRSTTARSRRPCARSRREPRRPARGASRPRSRTRSTSASRRSG